jgi:hypothetical protein
VRIATCLVLCVACLWTDCRSKTTERAVPAPSMAPTLVRLDFADRPLPEVVAALQERSGLSLRLGEDALEHEPDLEDLRVRLAADEPVPFWEATERLARAAGLRVEIEGDDPASVVLEAVPKQGVRGPVSSAGAFRCELVGLQHRRSLEYGETRVIGRDGFPVPSRAGDAGPDVGPSFETLRVRVRIQPEPRAGMRFLAGGTPRVIEATDDRGRSLVAPPGKTLGSSGYRSTGGPGALVAELPLVLPDPPGSAIRKLVGVAPMTIRMPRLDPLVIPLAGAVGRTFLGSGANVEVVRFEPGGSGRGADPATLELIVRLQEKPTPTNLPTPEEPYDLKFLDAEGRDAFGAITPSPPNPDGARRLTIRFHGGREPARLRYVGSPPVRVEIPFEFADVPLP